jgi:hypothetical protein
MTKTRIISVVPSGIALFHSRYQRINIPFRNGLGHTNEEFNIPARVTFRQRKSSYHTSLTNRLQVLRSTLASAHEELIVRSHKTPFEFASVTTALKVRPNLQLLCVPSRSAFHPDLACPRAPVAFGQRPLEAVSCRCLPASQFSPFRYLASPRLPITTSFTEALF